MHLEPSVGYVLLPPPLPTAKNVQAAHNVQPAILIIISSTRLKLVRAAALPLNIVPETKLQVRRSASSAQLIFLSVIPAL